MIGHIIKLNDGRVLLTTKEKLIEFKNAKKLNCCSVGYFDDFEPDDGQPLLTIEINKGYSVLCDGETFVTIRDIEFIGAFKSLNEAMSSKTYLAYKKCLDGVECKDGVLATTEDENFMRNGEDFILKIVPMVVSY